MTAWCPRCSCTDLTAGTCPDCGWREAPRLTDAQAVAATVRWADHSSGDVVGVLQRAKQAVSRHYFGQDDSGQPVLCPRCDRPMRHERGHYTCDGCHEVGVTCCEGAPV